MRNLKYIVLILALLPGFQKLEAQQLPQYTQFMLNDFAMNPAIAGTNPYWKAMSDDRYQWLGITDAPRTYMLTLNGPLTEKHIGIGAYLL